MNEDGEGNCFDVGDVPRLHPQLPIYSTNSIENVPMHLRISIRRAYLREDSLRLAPRFVEAMMAVRTQNAITLANLFLPASICSSRRIG